MGRREGRAFQAGKTVSRGTGQFPCEMGATEGFTVTFLPWDPTILSFL